MRRERIPNESKAISMIMTKDSLKTIIPKLKKQKVLVVDFEYDAPCLTMVICVLAVNRGEKKGKETKKEQPS